MIDNKQLRALVKAVLALDNAKEAQTFFEDLCTPQELEDLCLRWKIVDELKQGFTYREIHDRTQASLTTISRIAKSLNYGSGGYEKIYARLYEKKDDRH
jgi:TrpR-related protein YerC/YecD